MEELINKMYDRLQKYFFKIHKVIKYKNNLYDSG